MGIYKPTAISRRIKRSVDELTFCHVRGRNVVKTKIDENKSNTLLQQQQRRRWAEMQELDALFDEAVLIGFPSRAGHFTCHNAFVSANMGAVEVSDELEVTTDYTKIVCSQGRLRLPPTTVTADEEQHELTFSHQSGQRGKRSMPTDQLYVMVVEKKRLESELFMLNTRAELEPVVVALPADWSTMGLAIYVFVLSADGQKASNTGYLEI